MNQHNLLELIAQAAREGWTELDLSDHELTFLPPEISKLTQLRVLDLGYNEIESLPSELGQLTGLQSLSLCSNRLSSLPSVVSELSELRSLELGDNALTGLPAWITQLSGLRTLGFEANRVATVPSEVFGLPSLEGLDLRGNSLSVLPPEIGQLRQLRVLELQYNVLVTLPAEIGRLAQLEELYLSDNHLIALPREIAQLRGLRELDLQDNPDLPLPPEITAKSNDPKVIIRAYLDYLAGQTRPLNEIKLVLVGEGSVGKTSLVNRLLYDTFDTNSDKTEGIAIHRWQIASRESQIRMNVWDFGGQEIMHATHQFFLTKRTLYVLVLDGRLSEAENRLDYWLALICSFGADSPVLVVGNKTDQHPLDLDRRTLLAQYPTVHAILETSCVTGAGVANLRAAIVHQAAQMPHVTDPVPTTWFDVKAELEAMDTDHIPYRRYVDLCRAKGVDDPDSQRVLLGFLHDLGVVLHFPDPRLETTNILNPEWVTQGVYRILNTRLPFAEPGILTWDMLASILNDEPYQQKRVFIVDMMQKFELCYELPDRPHSYLIPDRLPKEAHETGVWDDALALEVHYNVLPGSILTRLIVRMHRHIHERAVWRTGVLLACDGSEAIVRADLPANRITIAVRGPVSGRRELLTRIREHLGAIHSTLAGLQADEKVPVPEHPNIPPVDYRWLRNLERGGFTEFPPPGLAEMISVSKLLDGIEQPEARRTSDSKLQVHIYGSQVGVIGDHSEVNGGIGFDRSPRP